MTNQSLLTNQQSWYCAAPCRGPSQSFTPKARLGENDTESLYILKQELEIKDQQLKFASDLLTKQGGKLKRMESNMNRQIHGGMIPHHSPPLPLMVNNLHCKSGLGT
ncbi:hypothetical protein LOTGIDRAFT_155868 [Lottia gigantea]|uniref:Uncharacterized protein n=1 Tax=Lottia gigantea TaxID=225164 RepID=V3YXQ5_LOTGI|nr:hypothetical protein LOTGIDRAFT_155868 [Lottia gigantea]ESO82833.1 hypothetical protein LOTGIDRAFT_155868 [Lottia gigantea]